MVAIHIPMSNTRKSYVMNVTFWKKEGSMNYAMPCNPRTGRRSKIKTTFLEGREFQTNYPIFPKSKIQEFPFAFFMFWAAGDHQ